jgi:hypothetical protein
MARVGQVPKRPRAAAEFEYYASKGLRPVKCDAENRAQQANANKRELFSVTVGRLDFTGCVTHG